MEERTLESKYVYRGSIIDLRLDTVSVQEKNTALREIIVHNGAVGILPVLPSGDIVLIKQYRKAAEAVTIEIPAGKIDGNEDPVECVKRELREETGYRAQTITHLINFYPAIGYSTEILYLYLTTQLQEGEQDLDSDENIELVTFPVQKVLDMISSGEIVDSKTIIALFYYAKNVKKDE